MFILRPGQKPIRFGVSNKEEKTFYFSDGLQSFIIPEHTIDLLLHVYEKYKAGEITEEKINDPEYFLKYINPPVCEPCYFGTTTRHYGGFIEHKPFFIDRHRMWEERAANIKSFPRNHSL